MRFVVCTLGLASLAMSQMGRMVLNQSIMQMVDPSMLAEKKDDVSSDGSCPWPEETGMRFATVMPDATYPPTTGLPPGPPPETTTLRPADLSESPTTQRAFPGDSTGARAGPIQISIQLDDESKLPDLLSASPSEGNLNELPDFDEHQGTTTKPEREHDKDNPGGDFSTPPLPTTELPTTPGFTTLGPVGESMGQNQTGARKLKAAHPQYMWTIAQQNVLLGGFYYSYFVFMVLGGRMAEIYGAKYVLLLSVGGSALISLATPWLAQTSFALLVMSRVVMGAIQAGVFPGMYALIAKWLTMTEASIYAPLIKMNLRLGMVLGSLLPGVAAGWPNVFYLTGLLCALWSLAWLVVATSDPADNKWVSQAELAHINRKKKRKTPAGPEVEDGLEMSTRTPTSAAAVASPKTTPTAKKTPWLEILTAPSVIGLIVVKLTFNYALDFLAIELPSYLNYVHHARKETISAITGPMFGIQVVLIVFVGWLAKVTVQKPPFGLDKTGVRKLFQGIASFGLSLTFFLFTFNDCNLVYVTVLLQVISLLSMFTAGGETMLPYDLSMEYPATIMAIANSVANLSGVTTTTLTGLVLGSQGGSYYRWNILIYLIAGANLVGGLCFTFLVKAEPIDFGRRKKRGANSTSQAEPEATGSVVAIPNRGEMSDKVK